MNHADPEETMNSLIGRSVVDWGQDGAMFHAKLDDGRVLIFVGLGILIPEESHVFH